MNQQSAYYLRQRLVFGAVLIAIGAALLLERFGLIEIHGLWHYWPAIVLLVGLNKVVGGTHARQTLQGLWLMFIGAWLYVVMEHMWGLTFRNTWPFFLIAWGVGHLLRPFVESYEAKHQSTQENFHGR